MKNKVKCSYINEEGEERNNCKDMPVTYCKDCETFYVLDREGNRTEIFNLRSIK
jgi:hypothetical protein